jgi:predicted hotdog family 3-hydroxylacyl-ACP dehydratase
MELLPERTHLYLHAPHISPVVLLAHTKCWKDENLRLRQHLLVPQKPNIEAQRKKALKYRLLT